jgi:hypothetical protein
MSNLSLLGREDKALSFCVDIAGILSPLVITSPPTALWITPSVVHPRAGDGESHKLLVDPQQRLITLHPMPSDDLVGDARNGEKIHSLTSSLVSTSFQLIDLPFSIMSLPSLDEGLIGDLKSITSILGLGHCRNCMAALDSLGFAFLQCITPDPDAQLRCRTQRNLNHLHKCS